MIRQMGEKAIRPCEGPCGRLTRPSSILLAKAPGTVVRTNGSHCTTCWREILVQRGELARPVRTKKTPTPEPDSHVAAGLERMMAARRARLAPTQRRRTG